MAKTLIRYFLYSISTQFILGFALYCFLKLISGFDFTIQSLFLFAFLWSIFYSLFNVVYYYFSLKNLGITNIDSDHLQSLIALRKISQTTLDDIQDKIDRFGQFKNFKIQKTPQSILLKKRIVSLLDGDDLDISSTILNDGRVEYELKANQSINYDLQASYFNIKNLRKISSYITASD